MNINSDYFKIDSNEEIETTFIESRHYVILNTLQRDVLSD